MKSKYFLYCGVFILALLGLIFVWQRSGRTIEIRKQPSDSINSAESMEKISPLNGTSCQNFQRRPLAVVLANDPVTRPLAGISQADLVFELPVITGSITRLIAVYLCASPDEIGSLRSARHDFIPLAMGLDAILVHWGGSHFALDKLNAGIMDNIDALKNSYNAFFRKNAIPRPHNGFTSVKRIINSSRKMGYRLENNFEGYLFQQTQNSERRTEKTLKIGYSYPYNVSYQYNFADNSYLRWRAGKKEIDRNNNRQIVAKNIVIMRAFSRQIEGPDYNDLDIEGSGECQVYQNGEVVSCVWKKDAGNPKSKLCFLDENSGEEIAFVPGQIWIEIVEPGQEVVWE
ncbi:MAG: DUF3048 domain-containing protein [Patescibacteria group bacterium]|nr:DUF3048 domain-containing protein [Patescibacteria group bacterium]